MKKSHKYLYSCGMTGLLILLLSLVLSPSVSAQSFAVKANGGSQGLGGEVALKIINKVNMRVGGNMLNYTYFYETAANEDYDVDARASLQNFSALLDWHPFGSSLRLSGGLAYNLNTFESDLLPKQDYTVGGDVFLAEDLGQLFTEVSFNPLAPVFTMGFGNAFRGKRLGLNMEGGVMLQGAPQVEMRATEFLEPSAEQAPVLENNISWFSMYPIFTLSLYYRIK